MRRRAVIFRLFAVYSFSCLYLPQFLYLPHASCTNSPIKRQVDGTEASALSMEASAEQPPDLKEAVEFLYSWMPDSDRTTLPPGFIIRNAMHALRARSAYSWASDVPWHVFLNDVLPYASLTEPRQPFREDPHIYRFFSALLNEHKAELASTGDVAVLLNRLAWTIVDPPIKFVAAPPCTINSYAPFETMERHNSSCTGLAGNTWW